MKNTKVTLVPLEAEDREQFIRDNQWAFKHGAMIEFSERNCCFEADGEIISRESIEQSMDEAGSETYRIMLDGEKVGGVILKIDPVTQHNHLDILFVSPKAHSRGIGYGAWLAVEALHPETRVWETCTPYFEKRNIHFYVNKCGFHIVEFWCEFHADSSGDCERQDNAGPPDEMFRFVKRMK